MYFKKNAIHMRCCQTILRKYLRLRRRKNKIIQANTLFYEYISYAAGKMRDR